MSRHLYGTALAVLPLAIILGGLATLIYYTGFIFGGAAAIGLSLLWVAGLKASKCRDSYDIYWK